MAVKLGNKLASIEWHEKCPLLAYFLTNKAITTSEKVVSYIFALIPMKNHLNINQTEPPRPKFLANISSGQLSLQILMLKKFGKVSEGSINFELTQQKVYQTVSRLAVGRLRPTGRPEDCPKKFKLSEIVIVVIKSVYELFGRRFLVGFHPRRCENALERRRAPVGGDADANDADPGRCDRAPRCGKNPADPQVRTGRPTCSRSPSGARLCPSVRYRCWEASPESWGFNFQVCHVARKMGFRANCRRRRTHFCGIVLGHV